MNNSLLILRVETGLSLQVVRPPQDNETINQHECFNGIPTSEPVILLASNVLSLIEYLVKEYANLLAGQFSKQLAQKQLTIQDLQSQINNLKHGIVTSNMFE